MLPFDYVSELLPFDCVSELLPLDCVSELLPFDYLSELLLFDYVSELFEFDYVGDAAGVVIEDYESVFQLWILHGEMESELLDAVRWNVDVHLRVFVVL